MKKLMSGTILLLLTSTLFLAPSIEQTRCSEPPETEWSRTYGGANDDALSCVIQTTDGGYALARSTESFGAGGSDGWLKKLASECEIEQVTDNTEDDFGPSVCVDEFGRPHIAWVRGAPSTYDVYYGVKEGSSWTISKVTSLSARPFIFTYLSLCLDSNGDPHIAALTETNRWDLWYIYWSESASDWVVESVANGGSQSHCNVVSLALGSDGSPHIAWAARWGGGLWGVFYAKKSGATWVIETVSHADDSAPSIALDSGDRPHVLWIHVDYLRNPRLQYASRVDGSWIKEDIPGAEQGFGNTPRQLFIDSSGSPHIAFSKHISAGHDELWYGRKVAGSWSLSQIKDSTFSNQHPSLFLNSMETPYVTWQSNDAGNSDVYLAKMDGSNWKITQVTYETMDEGNPPGPSLFIDSSDDVHLAWYGPGIGSGAAEVYYAISVVAPPACAIIDIHPDTLNLRSKGKWITTYIELPEGHNVNDTDVSTITLNDTVLVDSKAPTEIGDYDEDSIPDLMVKFDRSDVISYILANVNMTKLYEEKFMTITLTVTGYLYDDTMFEGTDTIRIILPGGRGAGKDNTKN